MICQMDEILNTAPCGFLSFTDDGTIILANTTLLGLLDQEPENLVGKNISSILPIASRIFYQTHFFPLLKIQGRVEEVYFPLRSKQGQDIPMLINAVRQERSGIITNNCIFIPIHQRIQYETEILKTNKVAESAIQAQKQAEAELRQLYAQALLLKNIAQYTNQLIDLSDIFQFAVDQVCDLIHADRVGIFTFQISGNYHNGEFIIESINGNFNSNLGIKVYDHCLAENYIIYYQQGRVQILDDIYTAEISECHRSVLEQLQIRANLLVPLLDGRNNVWGFLYVHQCSNPRQWQKLEVEFMQQVALQLTIAIQQVDIYQKLREELAQRQETEEQLRTSNQHLAYTNQELHRTTRLLEDLAKTDGLTQIANRRCFNEHLEQEWLRLEREQQSISLLLFDVDYFKLYNDTYGHQLGDDCLFRLAQAAQSVVRRPADLLARYGGEEFVVILPNTNLEGAILVSESIHQVIHELNIPHEASQVSSRVTISLGISTLIPRPEVLSPMLIHQADQALYHAKNTGRNQSCPFCPS